MNKYLTTVYFANGAVEHGEVFALERSDAILHAALTATFEHGAVEKITCLCIECVKS